ncbi:hypothetical protein ACFL9T_07905 [Thermodesulfobacteriota bacterium]
MAAPARLGGFKILKDVVGFSFICPNQTGDLPLDFFRAVAEEKINLPFITCIKGGPSWKIHLMVEAPDEARTSDVIQALGIQRVQAVKSVVFSLFPHKRNPEITSSLFKVFGLERIEPGAMANSPSAISIALKENYVDKISKALFGPFSFSAYRTPADWKLAQKGKEELYKEVVASYQEQRPKVYGLEYQEGHELLQAKLDSCRIDSFGAVFKEFSRLGLPISFFTGGPSDEVGRNDFVFCLPPTEDQSRREIIKEIEQGVDLKTFSPVTVFGMNGPHFGDRYGILSELLSSFANSRIDLLALNCTIASIMGVVPASSQDLTLQAVEQCFEVPAVIKKE